MKKLFSVVLSLGLIFCISFIAEAKTTVKTYKNCTELNKVYQGGVAKIKTAKNTKIVKGKKVLATSKYKPLVSADIYIANQKHDRDKDLIACER